MHSKEFEIVSGTILVSDPCYEKDGFLQLKLENVRKGFWTMSTDRTDEGSWGKRVAELICLANNSNGDCWECAGAIGVDSGQAGIFDEKHYRDDAAVVGQTLLHEDSPIIWVNKDGDDWYNLCCDKTLHKEYEGGGVIPFGAVSSSGFGDGQYDVFVRKNAKGEITGVKIVFLTDEEVNECPHCGGDCDSGGYCGECDAYEDDKSCGKCGDLLDYDGVCPSCIMEEEEGQDKLIFEDEEDDSAYNGNSLV